MKGLYYNYEIGGQYSSISYYGNRAKLIVKTVNSQKIIRLEIATICDEDNIALPSLYKGKYTLSYQKGSTVISCSFDII